MASESQLRVLIAGGGTGGHLYPGLAVAKAIRARRPDAVVSFAGAAGGIEARVVPREGFELDLLRGGGLKGKSIGARARGVMLIPVALVDAWRIVARRRPTLVIGVGGFSSGPVVLVAALRRVPTMVLEQNAVPGLTNRLLAPFVRAAAITFESAGGFFGSKAFVSGNPVRPEFVETEGPLEEAASGQTPGNHVIRVLVTGGSQGAHAINVAMVEAAPELAAVRPRLRLTHQTGDRDVEMVRTAYRRAGLEADVEAFLFDMGARLRNADLIVCRAGATTIAELSAVGRAGILIPLPTATDDHQRRNAEALAAAGAARLVPQGEATGGVLAALITELARDGDARQRMARAARGLARPDATRVIVDRALDLVDRC